MKALSRLRLYHALMIALMIFCMFWLFDRFFEEVQWIWFFQTDPAHYYVPPAVVILLSIIILIIALHTSTTFSWRRNLQVISKALLQLNEGRTDEARVEAKKIDYEFTEVIEAITTIEKRLEDQAKRSQSIIDEWSENEKMLKQDLVEQERNRIARELHDSVSQQLYAASMLLSALVKQTESGEEKKKPYKQIEKVINDAQADLRALLFQLRPIQLENKSFKEGIEQLVSRVDSNQTVSFLLNISEDHVVSLGIEDQLFRIAQEAVANTIRHAEAKEVTIFYKRIDKFLLLKITDDGKGFTIDDENQGGYGLGSMRERADEIGGTMKIISVEEQGTSIEVRVPLIERSKT